MSPNNNFALNLKTLAHHRKDAPSRAILVIPLQGLRLSSFPGEAGAGLQALLLGMGTAHTVHGVLVTN